MSIYVILLLNKRLYQIDIINNKNYMENENKENSKIIKISRKKLIVTIFVIILLFILGLGIYRVTDINSSENISLVTEGNSGLGMPPPTLENYNDTTTMQRSPSYQSIFVGQTPSVNDTREFLKTNYSANVKTRNVRGVMRDIKGAISSASGRIDQINEGQKNGYVSFVVPKTNFENFKNEIEAISNEKLITENVSSENLLNQKQSIETRQVAVDNTLSGLEKQKNDLTTKHNAKAKEIQTAIDTLSGKLDQLNFLSSKITDPVQKATLSDQGNSFEDNITLLKQQLASENSNYNANSKNLKNQIEGATTQSENVKKDDVNFTDNIETVNGYISIRWISLWELAVIFSPIHPTIIIIVLLIIAWYILKKSKVLPKVELV